ncbi:MAG: hypothetical protein LBL62_07825 [Planctomycetaceae bacterium]|jgi:hypothetical protein|nr:hypothetical protein [Planctomycetaceae bacterium]
MNTKFQVVFQVLDRFTQEQRNTTDEHEAFEAFENGDFVTINEITKTTLFTGQKVTTVISTGFPKGGKYDRN